MSKYNKYALELHEAFLKARGKITRSYAEYKDAEEQENRLVKTAISANEKTNPEYLSKLYRAKAEHTEKKEVFDAFNNHDKGVWADFAAERRRIDAEFRKALKADLLATPDKIDEKAIELLKADILTSADFENIAQTYSNNPTMLRLISKYATEAAKKDITAEERQALHDIAYRTAEGKTVYEQMWDTLLYNAEICSGHAHERNPSGAYVCSIANEWEHLSGEMINNF